MRPAASPAVAYVVACGQRRLFAENELQVGVLVAMAAIIETADDDGSLIFPRTGDLVGGEQNDAGVPGIAIDAQVHAPLLHRGVPKHVGCPHVSIDVVTAIGALRPVHCVELGKCHFLATFHDSLHGRFQERLIIRGVVIASNLPFWIGLRPALEIGGVGSSLMRTKDVVALRGFLVDDRRVVYADTLHGDVPIQALCLVGCQFCTLCMAWLHAHQAAYANGCLHDCFFVVSHQFFD